MKLTFLPPRLPKWVRTAQGLIALKHFSCEDLEQYLDYLADCYKAEWREKKEEVEDEQ